MSCVSSWPRHTYFVSRLGTAVCDVSLCSLVDKWCFRGVCCLYLHFVLVRICHTAGHYLDPCCCDIWFFYGYWISLIMCAGCSITEVPLVTKIEWEVIVALNVVQLLHWSFIIFQHVPKPSDVLVPAWHKLQNCCSGNRAVTFTAVYELPFPFAHYGGLSQGGTTLPMFSVITMKNSDIVVE